MQNFKLFWYVDTNVKHFDVYIFLHDIGYLLNILKIHGMLNPNMNVNF